MYALCLLDIFQPESQMNRSISFEEQKPAATLRALCILDIDWTSAACLNLFAEHIDCVE